MARLALRESFRDISFRLGGRRGLFGLLVAFLLPLVIGLLAYGIAWVSGQANFTSHPGQFSLLLLLTITLGPIVSGILVAGEEIGWRGYMLTRLIDARLPHLVLLSGLIWGLWHTPLIITGLYAAAASPWLSVALFMGSITTMAFVFARLRLETGSIWPPFLLHATWNSVIQGAFDPSTTAGQPNNWTGESGVNTLLVLIIISILFSLGRWTMIRTLPKRGEPIVREELPYLP